MSCLPPGRAGPAVWWHGESIPCLVALPGTVFLGPPESQTLSVRTCLGDDSAQAHGCGTDVRAVWRPWQGPPDALTRQDVEQGTAGRGAILQSL